MRLFDAVIRLPDQGAPPGARACAPAGHSKGRGETTHEAAGHRRRAFTPRLARAWRAEMAPAAFFRLVALWAGAVLIILLAVLTVRWVGG